MRNSNSYFLIIFLIIFSTVFLISCGKEKKVSQDYFNFEEFYSPSLSISSKNVNHGKPFSGEVILEGKYFIGCFGKSTNDIWRVSSKNHRINKALVVKKGNSKCQLEVTKVSILNLNGTTYVARLRKNINRFILSENFFMNPIQLVDENKDAIGSHNPQSGSIYLYANIKLVNANFNNKPEIQFLIPNYSEKLLNLKTTFNLAVKYIYRTFSSGSGIYAAVYVENEKGLYFSESGDSKKFIKVLGIEEDLEIRDVAFSNNTVYVAAFNNTLIDNRKGGLYYSERKIDGVPVFKKIEGMKNRVDINSVSSSNEIIYVATNDGAFYSTNGVNGEFNLVKNIGRKVFNKTFLFGNKAVLISENEVFYSEDSNSGNFKKLKYNFNRSAIYDAIIDGNNMYIGASNGVYHFKENKQGEFLVNGYFLYNNNITQLIKNENSLYATIFCDQSMKLNCEPGLYRTSLTSPLNFVKVKEVVTPLGVTIVNGTAYVSTTGVAEFSCSIISLGYNK